MTRKTVTSLGLVAGFLTAIASLPAAHAQVPTTLVTNGPQSNGVEASGTWSAQQNVRESNQYSALLRSNPGFRARREQKECGSITIPSLHAQCMASFGDNSGSAYGRTSYRRPRHHDYYGQEGDRD